MLARKIEGVQDELQATVDWMRDADVPDPLSMADVRARPDLVADILGRRSGEDRRFGRPRTVPFPKPTGGYRSIASLDPYATLELRRLADFVVPVIARLPANVMRTRPLHQRSTWKAEPWRRAKQRRDEAVQTLSHNRVGTLHVDVKNFYGCSNPDGARRAMSSAGLDDCTALPIARSLLELAQTPGVPAGLPVGYEGSAIIATLLLRPLDRALERYGVQAIRWVDDVDIMIDRAAQIPEVIALVDDLLARNGFALNDSKTLFVPTGDVSPIEISGTFATGGLLPDAPLLALALLAGNKNPAGVPSALGLLKARHDHGAVAVIEANPWVQETFPRHTASCLAAVGTSADPDWVHETLSAPTTDANAAFQMHLARVIPEHAFTPSLGALLFDRAGSLDLHRFGPVRDHYLAAAGRSPERASARRRRALEYADETASLNAKRAALTALRDGGASHGAKAALRHLTLGDPDLAPTAEWAAA